MRWILLTAAACVGVACAREPRVARAATDGVVDSVIPRAEALRRFRVGLDTVRVLEGGAPSRDALVRAYVAALEAADTTAIKRLTLSKAEFAWLYYPESAQGRPPYDLSPSLMWFMMDEQSRKGLTRALAERGGAPYADAGYLCMGEAVREGPNTLWGPCVVSRVSAAGDTIPERLFGQILGRDGVFKITTHANKF
ncbi:MAG TPA: hypothetical protein VFV65_00760 [Gemmatimonadales bacterium]|nr:hypothetical protein [Gemmatimonadales bacterium]